MFIYRLLSLTRSVEKVFPGAIFDLGRESLFMQTRADSAIFGLSSHETSAIEIVRAKCIGER